MRASTPYPARSLIVVSSDDGQFGLAMSFLRGQEFAERAAIALPESLHSRNKNELPVPSFPYTGLHGLLDAADTYEPDLVFLFSAYVFALEALVSPKSLHTLLSHLRQLGCRLITSDPLLGLGPQVTLAQVDTQMLAPGAPVSTRWLVHLMLRLRGPKLLRLPNLDDVTHLYHAFPPDIDDAIERIPFFNPTVLQPQVLRQPSQPPREGGGEDRRQAPDSRPRWLFVLSDTDLECQCALVGLRNFTDYLLGLLRYAAEVDRHPTLIAPPSMVERLAPAIADSAELLSFCPFAELERRLVEAEYAFYWDAASFSLFPRLANELPVFLFDRGYTARAIKPYYEIARACNFGGWEPPYLDQRQLFSPYVLAHLAKTQKPALRALRERWQSSPTPDKLVNHLLVAGIRPEPA